MLEGGKASRRKIGLAICVAQVRRRQVALSCSTAKGRVAGVGSVLNFRGQGFYGKHLDEVVRRDLLALNLDLLTLATSQCAGICDRPGLAVFCDQAFSILADPSGDSDGFSCVGLVAAAALTGGRHGQQERDSEKGKDELFHREPSFAWTILIVCDVKLRASQVKTKNQIMRIKNFSVRRLTYRMQQGRAA